MAHYVDGYVLPVPKKNVEAYRRIAQKAGKVWRDHGALEYRECVGDDLNVKWGKTFPRRVQSKPGETVVFSYIVFKSRAHRDKVNAKVMKDPRLAKMMDPKASAVRQSIDGWVHHRRSSEAQIVASSQFAISHSTARSAVRPRNMFCQQASLPAPVDFLPSPSLLLNYRIGVSRRTLGVVVLAILGLFALVAFARTIPAITTDGDFAVIELYTELASRGQLLLGPYSRFGWHHPGPLYFYLQAPLYVLSGHKAAALYGGALAMNVAAIATLAWVVARGSRGPLAALVTGACVLFAWRVPMFLASPWTAHVPVLPSITFMALCAAAVSGRAGLLPLTLAFGSVVAQTHLGFVPMVFTLSAATVAAVILDDRGRGGSLRPILTASGVVCVVLWLMPISEALTHNGGNAAALWQFFVTNAEPGPSLKEALSVWSYGLVGVLRPDFALPWGGHFVLRYLGWAIPCAIGQVLLLAAVARNDFKAGRRFEGCLAVSALAASVIGFAAVTRIRGDILDHEIFWLAAFGAINIAIIGSATLRAAAEVRILPGAARVAASMAAPIVCLLIGFSVGVRDLRSLTSFELRRRERATILATYESVRAYLREQNLVKPLIRIDGPLWGHAAGVLLRLQQAGTSCAVQDESLPMFTDAFAATGGEDAVVSISGAGLHQELRARPGNRVLREAHPVYVDAIAVAADQLRAAVIGSLVVGRARSETTRDVARWTVEPDPSLRVTTDGRPRPPRRRLPARRLLAEDGWDCPRPGPEVDYRFNGDTRQVSVTYGECDVATNPAAYMPPRSQSHCRVPRGRARAA